MIQGDRGAEATSPITRYIVYRKIVRRQGMAVCIAVLLEDSNWGPDAPPHSQVASELQSCGKLAFSLRASPGLLVSITGHFPSLSYWPDGVGCNYFRKCNGNIAQAEGRGSLPKGGGPFLLNYFSSGIRTSGNRERRSPTSRALPSRLNWLVGLSVKPTKEAIMTSLRNSISYSNYSGVQSDLTSRILDAVSRENVCDMEELMQSCSSYSRNQVCLELDRLSRIGELRLFPKNTGEYAVAGSRTATQYFQMF